MAVSIMIALGDKIKGCVDESTQEAWFLSYIGKSALVPFATCELLSGTEDVLDSPCTIEIAVDRWGI